MMKTKGTSVLYAVLAAVLYALNAPISKLLLSVSDVEPTMMAAFLYLGAGSGLLLYSGAEKALGKGTSREPLTRAELPYTVAMVVFDIAAPILLMLGISMSTSANASLLGNFEIVATSIIALAIFRETISKKLWCAIILVTAASAVLSFEGIGALDFSTGSLFVLGACLCWGFENNCTRMISHKSSVEIVIIKGLFSGAGSLIVALIIGEKFPHVKWIIAVLLLGFVAYGLSIHFYIMAQKELGAAKTSAYYSIAPFIGVAFGMIILGEHGGIQFYVALAIMIVGTYFMVKDTLET